LFNLLAIMNIFRFIADMLHLAAILTLLYRIKVSRNVVGKYPASHPSRTFTQIKQSLSPGAVFVSKS